MKFVTYLAGGSHRGGAILGDRVVDLASASHGRILGPAPGFLSDEYLLGEARGLIEQAGADEQFAARHCRPLASLELLSPIPRPGKVLCLGLNYRDHAAGRGFRTAAAPVPEAGRRGRVPGGGHRRPAQPRALRRLPCAGVALRL